MNRFRLLPRILSIVFLGIWLCAQSFSAALAYESSTLYNGSRGEEVRELQQALIDLGFLKGTADGVFGNKTEIAVRNFQKKNKLSIDGLAGKKTRQLILSKAQAKNKKATATPTPAPAAKTASASSKASSSSSAGQESSSLFGTYETVRFGDRGDRVKTLQRALITLGYLTGSADGVYGKQTRKAVTAYQRHEKLEADGVAGKKTLKAVQASLSSGGSGSTATPVPTATPAPAATPVPTPVKDDGELNPRISAPGNVQLLHWFNDVKPAISGGQKLLVYDPSSGLSWTLRVMSRGRHCDAEPLTAQDTRTMVAAFGGVNTWTQKAVYVKLPDGRWSVASTHDMPHMTGSVKNNNFDGHLCVHFLRDMDETQKNDPKYGVANQNTIRTYWKRLTGEEIKN